MTTKASGTFSVEELHTMLVDAGYLQQADFDALIAAVGKDAVQAPAYIQSKKLLTKDLWGQAVAEFYGIAYADLNSHRPEKETVMRIPQGAAELLRIVIFDENDTDIVFATDRPIQTPEHLAEIKRQFPGKTVSFAYALPEDIDVAFHHYRESLQTTLDTIVAAKQEVAPRILQELFHEAHMQNVSDIHIEPQKSQKTVHIRFRIDGVLKQIATFQSELYENVLNRIKILANLRIDEHERLQDGALRIQDGETHFDVRVSIVPTVSGEKVALRILSEYITGLSLASLGIDDTGTALLEEASHRPFGMIIMSGPTGSGKTTTAYALLQSIAGESVNITSIEDPVEYRLPDLNQIQVSPLEEITFARGLRSIVRQDPDVILVGEIRDNETAEIAVNAALTGHLLFSTFHATSASGTIPRILEMGVEPFLLASTLTTVVGQRLVRTLCEGCRFSEEVAVSTLTDRVPHASTYFKKKKITLYKSEGCDSCGGSGYKGRTVIVEILNVDDTIRELILERASAALLQDTAHKQGMRTLFEDGLQKVIHGTTSLDELLRVVEAPKK